MMDLEMDDADPPGDETFVRSDSSETSREAPLDFTAGSIVGSRYRIVSQIGEGGMGIVYRADDLTLGHPVALKYVSPRVANDPTLREHLRSEVRLGRQVTHPNVCRLHDLVEADEHQFVSMEFIHGEDLGSLLRRIGRLPVDKATAITVDIASGLAAAHDHGIVHRDLKPANILVDEKGRGRITDFGLAALSSELERKREAAGTLAYMAPEQLERGEATAKSDLYSLGLIMYEMFTGRQLFDGGSRGQIHAQHEKSKSRPSSLVPGLDPSVERIILRCLEENPSERPASAHAVLAALPGHDPLRVALAAGETPSPAMVAAAGEVGDLSTGRAWTLLVLFLALLAAVPTVNEWLRYPGIAGEARPAAALDERAREIAQSLEAEIGDDDGWWRIHPRYGAWVGEHYGDRQRTILGQAPPSLAEYHYRSSPTAMVPGNVQHMIQPQDPPLDQPGMLSVALDHEGNLLHLVRVPGERRTPNTNPVEWNQLLEATGLETSAFTSVEPVWVPPVPFDQHAAWKAAWPIDPSIDLRVEAASLSGEPVWFELSGPWKRERTFATGSDLGSQALSGTILFGLLFGAIFTRRNLARGRGDRRGALRLAAYVAAITFLGSMSIADHVGDFSREFALVLTLGGASLANGALVWLYYLAIEPYVRRRWPRILISWTRALEGRFTDPMVGRDILIGATVGLSVRLLWYLLPLLSEWMGGVSITRTSLPFWGLREPFGLLYPLSRYQYIAILYSLGTGVLLLFFRLIFRRTLPALIGIIVLFTVINLGGGYLPSFLVVSAATSIIFVVIFYRVGTFSLASAFFTAYFAFYVFSWSDPRALLALCLLLGLGLITFYLSLGGKPVFGTLPLDDDIGLEA